MSNSILDSVKLCLDGITPENTDFDDELIFHINARLMTLWQLGIGKPRFKITDRTATWADFLGDQEDELNDMVPEYVGLKIKTFWDPPQTGATTNALAEIVKELEFRLNIQVDPAGISYGG